MPKYFGKVGFADYVKERPGVVTEKFIERSYFGDVLRNFRNLQSADQLNDEISINNELSIVADPYAQNNFHAIRYAEFMGTRWKVTKVEVQYPRLILTLGGIYNAPTTGTAGASGTSVGQ